MAGLRRAVSTLGIVVLLSLTSASDDLYEDGRTWSACSATCREAGEPVYRYLVRRCSNYTLCKGDLVEQQECSIPKRSCPVDGGWSAWSQWTSCSQTCGGGVQFRTRTCTGPGAANGGRQCTGSHRQTNPCRTASCPVNHVVSGWTVWSVCRHCDSSPKYRIRTCTPTRHGGAPCPVLKQLGPCPRDVDRCPVDGGWTSWSSWERCPPCIKHITTHRRRSCTNPQPRRGGQACRGEAQEGKKCNAFTEECPVDGTWTSWNVWRNQPGDQTQIRARSCQGRKNNGKECPGPENETRVIAENGGGSGSGSGSGSGDDEDGRGSGT